ncbi:MAG: helix-turn-helix domain-containing protein, partial [Nocardioides sp.]
MITLEDWALIRRLAADGVPRARIAARLRISRTTVIKAVNSDWPLRHERLPGPTSFRGAADSHHKRAQRMLVAVESGHEQPFPCAAHACGCCDSGAGRASGRSCRHREARWPPRAGPSPRVGDDASETILPTFRSTDGVGDG